MYIYIYIFIFTFFKCNLNLFALFLQSELATVIKMNPFLPTLLSAVWGFYFYDVIFRIYSFVLNVCWQIFLTWYAPSFYQNQFSKGSISILLQENETGNCLKHLFFSPLFLQNVEWHGRCYANENLCKGMWDVFSCQEQTLCKRTGMSSICAESKPLLVNVETLLAGH